MPFVEKKENQKKKTPCGGEDSLLSSTDSPPPASPLRRLRCRSGHQSLSYLLPILLQRQAAGSFNHHGIRFSTTVPNDPDTHEDFMPTNKLQNSDLSLKDIVKQDVNDNPVMIYMKGVPDLPRCGFSSLAVRVLKEYYVPLSARNILEDPELKNAVKSFSNWPTFPQIFIKGEFVGGSDIILNMHQTGELKEMLKDIAANQEN